MSVSIHQHLQSLGQRFVGLHERKEDLFWDKYMGLADDPDKVGREFDIADQALKQFLQDPDQMAFFEANETDGPKNPAFNGWLAMFQANTIRDPEGRVLSAKIGELETELVSKRQQMVLGLKNPVTGEFESMSYKQLMLIMSGDPDEARRKAAYNGMLSVERFVLENGFLEIVKLRNKLARMLGYADFYDYRVSTIERMNKKDLFTLLDTLATALAPRAQAEVARVVREQGESASLAWNFGYLTKGKINKDLDPYFPLEAAVERWCRTFHGFGIQYAGAMLTLDLFERPGKYPNGFMHGPGLVYETVPGGDDWTSARINFTANAVPGQVGSGFDAMLTLLHEGGHAAHFSNIMAGAPCYSHEFAPGSTGLMETQSMFLDSFVRDPLWRCEYAMDRNGNSIPDDLNLEAFREDRRMRPWMILSLLTIAMGERQLYETPDDELTPERVITDARKMEQRLQGLSGGVRPLFSVPHLLAGESSANYHGYVLATMGVAQTRDHFFRFRPCLVNNDLIGPSLKSCYWKPGNSLLFSEMVANLTGMPLTPEFLIRDSLEDVDTACYRERELLDFWKYRIPHVDIREVDLDAMIRLHHGREVISDSLIAGDYVKMCQEYAAWVNTKK